MLAGGGFLLILAILAAAALRDVLSARTRLVAARRALTQTAAETALLATPDGRASATRRIDLASDEVAVAGTVVNGSTSMRMARFVPFLSTQRSGLLRLIEDSKTALSSTKTLLTDVDGLAAQGKVSGARVPLGALAAFEADLRTAGSTLAGLNHSGAGLVGPLGHARGDFNALAVSTGNRLLGDAGALRVAQSLMGSAGPRHYFVALENDAEMRDQGSVLSYAAMSFDHGQIHVDQHGSVNTPLQIGNTPAKVSLVLKAPADIPIPPGTSTVFGRLQPTQVWANVDATADFAFSARAMQAMYRQATGQQIDGVFSLDVPALSALLSVVGPVTVPGVSVALTAENAGTVLLHDLYDAFPPGPEQLARHELLSEVATAVVNRIAGGTFDPVPLTQQLATAAAGGHVRAWSADAAEELVLEKDGLGGGPAVTGADRTFHVAVENRNATKMDYYIHTATRQKIEITAAGSAIVRTTIAVHNTAPVGTPASFAVGPDGFGTTQPAEYWAWALLWGPSGAVQPGSVGESGLNLSDAILDRIYASQSKQVTFVTVIPNAIRKGKLELRYVPQPRLFDPTLDVVVQADGWRINGAPTWTGPWNRTLNLSWKVQR